MSARSRRFAVTAVLSITVALLAGCSGSDGSGRSDGDPAGTTETTVALARAALELRPLHVEDRRIVDDRGREVLLRGANVNSFGEYAQPDPDTAPTAPVTDEDWDTMAANGFSVVRLIMSWSRLEPARGEIDQDHLDELRRAIEAAN